MTNQNLMDMGYSPGYVRRQATTPQNWAFLEQEAQQIREYRAANIPRYMPTGAGADPAGTLPLVPPGNGNGGGFQVPGWLATLFPPLGAWNENLPWNQPGSTQAGMAGPGSLIPGVAGGAVTGGLAGALMALLGGMVTPPWETAPGEGWMLPWTERVMTEQGWTQPGGPNVGAGGVPGPVNLPAGGKAWTNAAKDGSSPATVAFIKQNGMITWVNLRTGESGKYRPKKHIVLSSNPRVSAIRKFDRTYKRLQKTLRKFTPRGKPTISPMTRYLSPVERKQLKAGG